MIYKDNNNNYYIEDDDGLKYIDYPYKYVYDKVLEIIGPPLSYNTRTFYSSYLGDNRFIKGTYFYNKVTDSLGVYLALIDTGALDDFVKGLKENLTGYSLVHSLSIALSYITIDTVTFPAETTDVALNGLAHSCRLKNIEFISGPPMRRLRSALIESFSNNANTKRMLARGDE